MPLSSSSIFSVGGDALFDRPCTAKNVCVVPVIPVCIYVFFFLFLFECVKSNLLI